MLATELAVFYSFGIHAFVINKLSLILKVLRILLRKSLTGPLYKCLNLGQVIADMDSLALVELGGLENPQVVAAVVAEGHRLPVEVLLQDLVLGLLLHALVLLG